MSCSSLSKIEKQNELDKWKAMKQVKKEIEEAEDLLKMAEKRTKIEESIKKRNKKIRKLLVVREQKKQMDRERDDEIRRIKEMDRRIRKEESKMLISQYHEKDIARIQQKIKNKKDEHFKMEERKKQQLERLTRPVLVRRESDSLFKATKSSSEREKQTKEQIDLIFTPNSSSSDSSEKMSEGSPRRRSVGDLYTIDNLPRLATPQWRTLV